MLRRMIIGFGFFAACLAGSSPAKNYSLVMEGNVRQDTVPHFWSRCVGTGTMELCLRKEWRDAARMGVEEAGFMSVRGHGVLSRLDIFSWDGAGEPTYNWTKFDQIYDFLVDTLHMHPLVELSFCPEALAPDTEISPPKDYTVWQAYIKALVNHCIERYGREEVRKWYWEVWNEYDFSGFWSGTEAEYYKLYQYTAAGAKSADSLIIIGGPAGVNFQVLDKFAEFCRVNDVPLDFLSNHTYGPPGPTAYPVTIRNDNRIRSNTIGKFGRKLLSMNTEFNTTWAGGGSDTSDNAYSMDSHVNAAFIAKSIKLLLDDMGTYQLPDVLTYWVISDVFDEGYYIERNNFVPFAQVFGLINYQGIPKAAFNQFRMLHMMGTTRLKLTGGTGDSDGVDAFATVNNTGSEVAVMVYNFYDTLRGHTAIDTVALTIGSLPFADDDVDIYHYRIDSLHSNPHSVWLQQGQPVTPTTQQWEALRKASGLAELVPVKTVAYTGMAFTDTFSIPRQAVSLILFKKKHPVPVTAPVKQHSGCPITFVNGTVGTSLPLQGITLNIYTLDGRCVKKLSTPENSVPLNTIPGLHGIVLVEALSGGHKAVKKVYCQK